MPRYASPSSFVQEVKKWMAQKMKYETARDRFQRLIDEIDSAFHSIGGGASSTGKRRGRPPGSGRRPGRPKGSVSAKGRGRGRRKRGSFSVSGEQSILAFVKKHGSPSTAEVNKHWHGEGRGGKADNALTKLVKQGALKRVKSKDARGSRYQVG